jgi:DNA-binding CsgD family transcriptional regulator
LDGEVYAVLSIPTSKERVSDDLTPAEREVLALLLDGRSNAEIAIERRTSVRTVANQVAALFRKLGVSSRRELVALSASEEASTERSSLTK